MLSKKYNILFYYFKDAISDSSQLRFDFGLGTGDALRKHNGRQINLKGIYDAIEHLNNMNHEY